MVSEWFFINSSSMWMWVGLLMVVVMWLMFGWVVDLVVGEDVVMV